MRKISWMSAAPPLLTLLLLVWATPACASDWIKPLKDLITQQTTEAMEHKEKEEHRATNVSARFQDNGNGTLTDRKSGLIWLKNASCGAFFADDQSGGKNSRTWHDARVAASNLADGFCDLKDGSQKGDWRLPTREELLAIAKDTTSKEAWQADKAFTGLQSFYYWSSSVGDLYQDYAFYVGLTQGIDSYAFQLNSFQVLPVRSQKKKP